MKKVQWIRCSLSD